MQFRNVHIKLLTTCILTTALLSTSPPLTSATQPIKVVTATGVISTDVAPYMLKGTVMVSLQTIPSNLLASY